MTETVTHDSSEEGLFFPASRQCPFSAPPEYTQFREDGGLHKVTASRWRTSRSVVSWSARARA